MGEPLQQMDFNGIQYSPITFEEFAGHTKYSLFGVPRYRWTDKPVVILGTFSTRQLTYTRKDFGRFDRQMGHFAYLKPPSGGDAGPSIALGPAFDDAAWTKCKTLWQVYSASNEGAGDSIPRFFFLARSSSTGRFSGRITSRSIRFCSPTAMRPTRRSPITRAFRNSSPSARDRRRRKDHFYKEDRPSGARPRDQEFPGFASTRISGFSGAASGRVRTIPSARNASPAEGLAEVKFSPHSRFLARGYAPRRSQPRDRSSHSSS